MELLGRFILAVIVIWILFRINDYYKKKKENNIPNIKQNHEVQSNINPNIERQHEANLEAHNQINPNIEKQKEATNLEMNNKSTVVPQKVFKKIAAYPKKKIIKIRPANLNTKDYIVFDLETIGSHITQIGALKFIDNKQVAEFNEYVNPGIDGLNALSKNNIVRTTTGITPNKVKDKPTIDKIMPKFIDFVGDPKNIVWIGHNSDSYDLNLLVKNGLNQTDFNTIDTYKIAKEKLKDKDLKDYKLTTLKSYYAIYNRSHDALDDSKATAIVFHNLRDNKLNRVVEQQLTNFNGLRFCITGMFDEMGRKDMERLIEKHGGKVTGSVSHVTNYLILGQQVANNLVDGVHSSKELAANEYGTNVISYSEFTQMLNSVEASQK